MDDDNNQQPQPWEQEPTNQPTNQQDQKIKDQRSKIKQKEQETSNNKNKKEKNQKIPPVSPCFFCTDLWFCWNLSIKIGILDIC